MHQKHVKESNCRLGNRGKGFHEKIIFLFIQKMERNIIIEQYRKIFIISKMSRSKDIDSNLQH